MTICNYLYKWVYSTAQTNYLAKMFHKALHRGNTQMLSLTYNYQLGNSQDHSCKNSFKDKLNMQV